MATQAQIDANRRNAKKSTGPKTPPGKAASGQNATTHGLSGGAALVPPEHEAEGRRHKRWSLEIKPGTLTGRLAIGRAVVWSLRIEDCQRALDAIAVEESERARRDWDHARRVEALSLAERLARRPALVVGQLQETRQGAAVMIERWEALARSLELGSWDESDRSAALDLLGVPRELRKPGQTPLDAADGFEEPARVRAAIDGEVARLRDRIEAVLAASDAGAGAGRGRARGAEGQGGGAAHAV
jgi:hypothetical protein